MRLGDDILVLNGTCGLMNAEFRGEEPLPSRMAVAFPCASRSNTTRCPGRSMRKTEPASAPAAKSKAPLIGGAVTTFASGLAYLVRWTRRLSEEEDAA